MPRLAHIVSMQKTLTIFLGMLAVMSGSLSAAEFPLIYKTQTMETVTVDEAEFAEVDIGELQPAGGGDAVFGIILPQAAVVRENREAQVAGVVTRLPEGGLIAQTVQIGAENEEKVEIIEGVLPGDTVLLTETQRIYQRYRELEALYSDPRRSPDVVRENRRVYERFFLYTGVTLIIAIPVIIWLNIRARRATVTSGEMGE